jgi:hypothetical protein
LKTIDALLEDLITLLKHLWGKNHHESEKLNYWNTQAKFVNQPNLVQMKW